MADLVSLKRKREFDVVFQRGRRGGNRCLSVLSLAGEAGVGLRYGLIVSRRNAGNAVRRNKIRRRLREALSLLLGDSGVDLDVVLVVRACAMAMTFWDLVAVIRRALPREVLTAANPAMPGGNSGEHP